MKSWMLVGLFLSSLAVNAASVSELKSTSQSKLVFDGIKGYLAAGVDYRGERDSLQSIQPRTWKNLSFGIGMGSLMTSFDYSFFTESSGNETLNIERKTETALVFVNFETQDPWALRPYIGLGGGGYREEAKNSLYGKTSTEEGAWIPHVAGALGVRWASAAPFLLSLEGRINSNKLMDPGPQMAVLLKMGIILGDKK